MIAIVNGAIAMPTNDCEQMCPAPKIQKTNERAARLKETQRPAHLNNASHPLRGVLNAGEGAVQRFWYGWKM
jgi:hypothetical protein